MVKRIKINSLDHKIIECKCIRKLPYGFNVVLVVVVVEVVGLEGEVVPPLFVVLQQLFTPCTPSA